MTKKDFKLFHRATRIWAALPEELKQSPIDPHSVIWLILTVIKLNEEADK